MYMYVRMFTCVHAFVHMSVPQCTHGGQKSICGSWFFLSTMWVQGLKSSHWVWGKHIRLLSHTILSIPDCPAHIRFNTACFSFS